MTLNISLPEGQELLRPKITVVGVGGAGGNAVNNMINSNLEGVDFLVANTDAQALDSSSCERKIQLGLKSTKGLGAGMRPDIGKSAAEEAEKDIESKLAGSNMVFIAAGMGGGTGTGSAPVIAKIARENGILSVGVVTKPFHFEGIQRMRIADDGIAELEQYVDTLIIIPNQNLFRIANEKTGFAEAFKMADDVLYAGVRGVTDLMVMPGLINLDFSDVKTVMSEMGKAMMGTGEAQGENRAVAAAEAAIANPLIDDVSLKGAKGLIINITGGNDLTLYEVDEAANRIREEADIDANIIFGSTCDDRLEGVMRVSIVATGIQLNNVTQQSTNTKPSLKIDNSVYQKPLAHSGFSILQSSNAVKNNLELTNSEENLTQEEQSFAKEISEEQNTEQTLDSNTEDNITQNNEEIEHQNTQEIGLKNSEETESINNNIQDHNYSFEEENKIEEPNHGEESTISKSTNNTNETLHSNAMIEEETLIDEVKNENTTVKRISLFDGITEPKHTNENEMKRKEPFLNDFMDSQNDEESNQMAENEDIKDEFHENVEIDEDIKQEEELLDIPTFLRRQAN